MHGKTGRLRPVAWSRTQDGDTANQFETSATVRSLVPSITHITNSDVVGTSRVADCDSMVSLTTCSAKSRQSTTGHAVPATVPFFDTSRLVPFAHSILSYARFTTPRTGDAGMTAGVAACSFCSIHESSVARRTSLRRPRETTGMGGHPGTRPATALQT